MHLHALYLVLAGAAGPLLPPVPVALSGRVTSADGTVLRDVRVAVAEIDRLTTTNAEGRYRLPQMPGGTYSVTFARIGYAPAARRAVIGSQDVMLDVTLTQTAVEIPPIQVTATPLATTALASPQPLSVLGGEELRAAIKPSLGETLEGQVGLRNLSTGSGIGKPVIRGLTSNRVLVLADGQRLETQQWGDEHSPNVESADAERIEVIRGPASVLYGSDALGGVINVVPRSLPDATGGPGFTRGGFSTAFSSNTREPEGTLSLEGANGGFGFRANLSGRKGKDVRTPEGQLFNSGVETINGSAAVGIRGGWGSVTASYAHRNERIEIHEDPAEDPAATPFQRIGEDRAKVSLSLPVKGGSRIETNLGYERNRRREFEEAAATDVALGLLSRTWTGEVHLHHVVGSFAGILGLSGLRNDFGKFGEESLIPNSRAGNLGAYLFEQVETGPWHLSFGARYDHRSLDVEDDADLGVSAQKRSWNSVTGNVGILFKVTEPLAVVLNVGRGFRAPSSFDLFSNGVHEGTVAFERGNPSLRNETSLNTDLAFRVQSNRVRLEIGGFLNRINDYIYTRPTGEFDPASGFEIFDVVQGDARLAGVEASAEYHPTSGLHFKSGLDFVHGQNTGTATPLPFVPPMRWTYGVRLEGPEGLGTLQRPFVELGGETNARQTRLDPSDSAPEGYSLVNAAGGVGVDMGGRTLDVHLSVRNLFDKSYAGFLSRYKRYALNPGRNLTLRISMEL